MMEERRDTGPQRTANNLTPPIFDSLSLYHGGPPEEEILVPYLRATVQKVSFLHIKLVVWGIARRQGPVMEIKSRWRGGANKARRFGITVLSIVCLRVSLTAQQIAPEMPIEARYED